MKPELDEHPNIEDFRIVLEGVRKFNRAQRGKDLPRPVASIYAMELDKL